MIQITFEAVSRYDLLFEPVQVTIPFVEGALFETELSEYCIVDSNRSALPTQCKVTGRYPDGSIRFLHCVFLGRFAKNKPAHFFFGIGDAAAPVYHQVALERLDTSAIVVANGALSCTLAPANSPPIGALSYNGITLTAEQIEGPVLYDEAGTAYTFHVGDAGWEVIDSGPVMARIRGRGEHRNSATGTWFSGVLTLTVYAESQNILIDHQIINTEVRTTARAENALELTNEQAGLKYSTDFATETVSGLTFMLHLPADSYIKRMATSSFNSKITEAGSDADIAQLITADSVIETPNEMFPEVLFSVFGCDLQSPSFGVCASIYQAYQNFPKALSVAENTLTISLFPREHAAIAIPQGVAKTSKFQLSFHEPGLGDEELMDLLLRMEMPPVGSVQSTTYIQSGVYDPFVSDLHHHPTERFLYRFVDSRAKGLGFLHFGDCPEWEYVKQGRSKGRDIWINNEYDMPHNFIVLFARSGDRRYFDYFLAAIRHWMDVDLCHFHEEDFHKGLLYTHSVEHVSGQPVPSHQWVEGFFDYYHYTGDPVGREIAITIGEQLKKMINLPLYQKPGFTEPRELGWTLRTFIALYKETHDETYLSACEPIIDTYCAWAETYGTWVSPYPENYMDRVPFMIHVGVVGLYQYYLLRPEERIKDVLVQVIDDLRRECLHPITNMFMGKQHASVRFQNVNGMVLESLAIGFKLTQDISYITAGLGMFSWITQENAPPLYDFSKVKRDDFTVIYHSPVGPKRCAQSLLPLLHYYAVVQEEGLLEFEY